MATDDKTPKEEKPASAAHDAEKRSEGEHTNGAGHEAQRKSLEELVAESNSEEAKALKLEIDQIRKERIGVVIRLKDLRHRISYKEAELVAVEKLVNMEKQSGKEPEVKRIGYLRRMKNRLEFKIATEAQSLAAERDLIRKIGEVNAQLNEALKLIRLEKKVEYIKGDIARYQAQLTEMDKKMGEFEAKLDDKYRELRRLLGVGREKRQGQKFQPKPMPGINLEDIAVIKRRDQK